MSEGSWYVRAPGVAAVVRADCCVFVRPGRGSVALQIDGEAMAELWGVTARPVPAATLTEGCDAATLGELVAQGLLVRGSEQELAALRPQPNVSGPKRCRRMVLGVSGSISCVAMLDYAMLLADTFADEVEVVVSEGAQKLLRTPVFEHHGFRTWTTPYEPRPGIPVPHSFLATTAELILVAPASAHTLHRLAAGACSDMLSLIVAGTRAPVVIAPSMNEHMWTHPPIARNVAQLRADGMWVVEPYEGFRILERETVTSLGSMGFHPEQLAPLLVSVLERHRAG